MRYVVYYEKLQKVILFEDSISIDYSLVLSLEEAKFVAHGKWGIPHIRIA